jgi:DNA-directed RNA polymerase specialized sigma24 family protein
MTAAQMATGVATTSVPSDAAVEIAATVDDLPDTDWVNDLGEVRDAIDQARDVLRELFAIRASLVIDAWDEGMPQREIGWELGISHTAVQKIIAGWDEPA